MSYGSDRDNDSFNRWNFINRQLGYYIPFLKRSTWEMELCLGMMCPSVGEDQRKIGWKRVMDRYPHIIQISYGHTLMNGNESWSLLKTKCIMLVSTLSNFGWFFMFSLVNTLMPKPTWSIPLSKLQDMYTLLIYSLLLRNLWFNHIGISTLVSPIV